ncbi:hypothetical protein K4E_26030 [Enterococcus thailandicus]|nr:hypothetical protein K4E_26030 [Enterococcus thailandicus]
MKGGREKDTKEKEQKKKKKKKNIWDTGVKRSAAVNATLDQEEEDFFQ